MNPTTVAEAIEYPYSDGAPLGETDWHITSMFALLGGLREHFARRDDVYVASNMFLYYAEGEPKKNRAPDIMVIFGVPKHTRNIFKTWEEGAVPSVIVELSSPQTIREDLGPKRELYARLGVAEYYLFDPLGQSLDPRFQGFQLRQGVYLPFPLGPDGGIPSPVLGLRMVPEDFMIRLVDVETGRLILTNQEKLEALEDQELETAEARRIAEVERDRAEAERDRAEAERQATESERQKTLLLSAEIERLRALLNLPTRPEDGDLTGSPGEDL